VRIADIRRNAFAMPVLNPAYPRPPFRFLQREYFIVAYETDPDALHVVVPEPLIPDGNQVNYEFIRTPDASGFGNYTESGQAIPVIDEEGRKGSYTHAMYLDDEGPIAGGREIWGFQKKSDRHACRSIRMTRCSARSTMAPSVSPRVRWASSSGPSI
jgi:acetoacetate decarboxylase